jgi:hypothetical protein
MLIINTRLIYQQKMEVIKMKRIIFSTVAMVLIFSTICMAQVMYLSLNKDVQNKTGSDAHGIKIVLKGQFTVIEHFDGLENANHFGEFTVEVDVENDETILWWHDPKGENDEPRPIPDDEWVHIGYRLNLPAEILETYWTDENGDLIGYIMQPPQEVIFEPDSPNLELRITNNLRNGMPISFDLVGYAVVEQEIPLADLNADNPLFSNLTSFAGASGNIQLNSGSSESFDIPRNTDLDKPETYAIYLKHGINGDNTVVFKDFGHFGPVPPYVPPVKPTDIPTVSQWGLIIMAVLLVTVGAVVIVRRSGQLTA